VLYCQSQLNNTWKYFCVLCAFFRWNRWINILVFFFLGRIHLVLNMFNCWKMLPVDLSWHWIFCTIYHCFIFLREFSWEPGSVDSVGMDKIRYGISGFILKIGLLTFVEYMNFIFFLESSLKKLLRPKFSEFLGHSLILDWNFKFSRKG
jgi:hypothetical protein